ncbi:MAG TPA: acetylxylan esterase [bacterium]|nr:acetylxylan esterase [bacterium]
MRHVPVCTIVALTIGLSIGSNTAATEPIPWDMKALSVAPKVYDDPEHCTDEVKAIFYEGLPWKGNPTRIFAYYGLPKTNPGEKVPAMVLVHGGGGSAFAPWVRLWLSRGYAAIAMDTCGCISSGGYRNHPRHDLGGPPGWGGFNQIDEPIQDQWTYHAVADAILAHSLIRSFPEVDAEQIDVTGISWGGYLTCIVAGVDSRFRFAAPVYGCGFLGDNSAWLDTFEQMGKDKAERWLKLWDPSVYLPFARMPILWVTGTNDFAYPMDSLQKSYRLPHSRHTLCIRVRMPHAHGGPGENPEEIHAMAESLSRDGIPLPQIINSGRKGTNAWAKYKSRASVIKAELNYTKDTGKWMDRDWATVPAELDTSRKKVSAVLPEGVSVYYFNLIDDRGLVVSTEHEELQ